MQYTSTDDAELETLPVVKGDGSVVIMVANHAVNTASDNNGPGAARSVQVDVSALGNLSSGSFLTIDKSTSAGNGPIVAAMAPAKQMTFTLDGYAVAFLTLNLKRSLTQDTERTEENHGRFSASKFNSILHVVPNSRYST